MDLFIQYRPSERRSSEPLRRTFLFGLILITLFAALLYLHRIEARPDLWAAFGISIGTYVLLRAAATIGVTSPAITQRGQRMAATRDVWFPLALFIAQSVFLFLAIAVFWITFCEVGFPARAWHHVLVLLLALAIPAYRVARERLMLDHNDNTDLRERFFRYLLTILVSVLLAGLATPLLDLSRELQADNQLMFLLLLWSAALLVSTVCVLLFVDRWMKASRRHTRPSQAERPARRVDNPRDAWGP